MAGVWFSMSTSNLSATKTRVYWTFYGQGNGQSWDSDATYSIWGWASTSGKKALNSNTSTVTIASGSFDVTRSTRSQSTYVSGQWKTGTSAFGSPSSTGYATVPALPSYTYTYKGGTGATPTDNKTQSNYHDKSVTVLANPYTRVGYRFDGWKGSNGTTYQPGANLSYNGALTLDAIWTPITSHLKIDELSISGSTINKTQRTIDVTYGTTVSNTLFTIMNNNKTVYETYNKSLSKITDYLLNNISIYNNKYMVKNGNTYTWNLEAADTFTLTPTYSYESFVYTFYTIDNNGNQTTTTKIVDIRNNGDSFPKPNITTYGNYYFYNNYIEVGERTGLKFSDFPINDYSLDVSNAWKSTALVNKYTNISSNKYFIACYQRNERNIPTNTYIDYFTCRTDVENDLEEFADAMISQTLNSFIKDEGEYVYGYLRFNNQIKSGDVIVRASGTKTTITDTYTIIGFHNGSELSISLKDDPMTAANARAFPLAFSKAMKDNNSLYILFTFIDALPSTNAYDIEISTDNLTNVYAKSINIPINLIHLSAKYFTLDINENANVIAFGGEANDSETKNMIVSYIPLNVTEKSDNEKLNYFTRGVIVQDTLVTDLNNGTYLALNNCQLVDNTVTVAKIQAYDTIRVCKRNGANNSWNFSISIQRDYITYTVNYYTVNKELSKSAVSTEDGHFIIYSTDDNIMKEI